MNANATDSDNDHPWPTTETVSGLGLSPTLAINEESARLEGEGRDIYRLGLGQSPFPVPEEVVAELREHAGEKDYLPVRGLERLREAVAGHHERTRRRETAADNVLIGPGSKELLYLLQLVFDGEVWAPAPSWVSYEPQAAMAGRTFRWLPTSRESGWRLTAEGLDEACRTHDSVPKLLILNYPNNPTGMTYGRERLESLAEVARRHDVLVLSDEIYCELDHEGDHASLAEFYPEGTVTTGGLSKWCGAGGWRLGTAVFPEKARGLLDAVAAVASETFTSVSAPIQYAAIRAFEGSPAIDDYLERSRAICRVLGGEIAGRLRGAGADVDDPEGGFYLLPDFTPLADQLADRDVTTSDQLARRALRETGVAFLPGTAFGRPDDELTARLAYVNFDGAAALEAARETDVDPAFVETHCDRTIAAVNRLCEWVAG